MPFLPGDSLLFAVGALASLEGGGLDVTQVWCLLVTAAILGDNINYQAGRLIGPKIFSRPQSLFLNPKNLERTQAFYDKHGAKTVLFARFLPIFRTFAPFVAGVGKMNLKKFVFFSVSGSILWMSCFLGAGYFFGNIPIVKKNFTVVVMAAVILPGIPILITVLKDGLAAYRAHRASLKQ